MGNLDTFPGAIVHQSGYGRCRNSANDIIYVARYFVDVGIGPEATDFGIPGVHYVKIAFESEFLQADDEVRSAALGGANDRDGTRTKQGL
jgi:hypothetical protein